MTQPTAFEQYMLELINRARLNPLGEANLFGIDLNAGLIANTISDAAKQPLAFNLLLNDSARSHSQWMLDTDTFSHTGAGGSSAGDRIEDAGYQFTGSSTWGENIGYTGTTGTLDVNNAVGTVHQGLFESSGHRKNILNNSFREIGLATLRGDFEIYDDSLMVTQNFDSLMVTQNFAKSGSDVFLTGVAFDDSVVVDDFYSVGEGLGGIEVTAVRQSDNSSFTTTTMTSGGYQIALDAGTYDVSFANNNQTIGNTSQISIGSENIKLDLNLALNIDNLSLNLAQHIGEVGQISDLNHNNQTIQLDNTYLNPVVFALPLSFNGVDPAVARITSIENNSFSIFLQEPEYKDDFHTQESLSYLVLEAGTWELEDGTILEVGSLDTNSITTSSEWESIDFNSDFQQTPVILSQVQTYNGNQFVRTRQNSFSSDGFQLAMEEEEALKPTGHVTETLGWFAIESGSGSWDGLDYQSGHLATDHNWYTKDFNQSFEESPNLFASLASFYGSDSAGLRYRNLDTSQVEIKVEEDQSLDNEIGHVREIVDFLAIAGSGDLSATAYDPINTF